MGNSKKQKGVTLVGVLVGITILSIALAAQIRLLGNTIRRDTELRNLIIATNLAREGIEILFSWRVTGGWENGLKEEIGGILCADIRLNKINHCTENMLNFVSYPEGNESFRDFKTYLYTADTEEFGVPAFWRAMTVKSCNPEQPGMDDQCLILVATAGWDACSSESWRRCVDSSECPCKLVKLEKKIYNWYVP